ncbi:AAA family ATPase, partial [Patescibacteria group bacterium]
MYLRKLEITGFKSFANKTILDFCVDRDSDDEKKLGITAIVGPNGSGKSNIADAMRWVMGEQSVKNLRGKKSEDVIFAGSGTKSRLGHASVSLYFDNSDKRIPVEFSEVVV